MTVLSESVCIPRNPFVSFLENWFLTIENELQSKPQYNSVDVRKQLISAAKIIESL